MARLAVTVVVPAYNAEATLEPCLAAINVAMAAGDALILYDDGATDRTTVIAHAAGATVMRNDGAPKGPAHGRNAAAFAARTPLILFVDADVVIRPDVIDRLAGEIAATGAAAAFGCYDERPQSRRVTSLYANLRHHYVHLNGARDASTFWSGIGMIKSDLFRVAGGYDSMLYRHPSIEDVELGMRLAAAGHRIRLVAEAQGTHCKDWSLWRVWHTDIVRRAYPWAELIIDRQTACIDLNLETSERITAVNAAAILVFAFATLFSKWFLPMVLVAALTYGYRNCGLFALLTRRIGFPGVIGAIAMHWCYHLYAMATFASVAMLTTLRLRRRPQYQTLVRAKLTDA
jgi:glycosyltransferase involved in cell wall biosynthesis